jgi:hypothetical protein
MNIELGWTLVFFSGRMIFANVLCVIPEIIQIRFICRSTLRFAIFHSVIANLVTNTLIILFLLICVVLFQPLLSDTSESLYLEYVISLFAVPLLSVTTKAFVWKLRSSDWKKTMPIVLPASVVNIAVYLLLILANG